MTFPGTCRSDHGAWTFVEMLVAIALSSVCLGAGALALQSITSNAKRATSLVDVDIGTTTNLNFYGKATSQIRTYMAPNYGKLMFAQELRQLLIDDSLQSSAVFCLPRAIPSTIRPSELLFPGGVASRPRLDTPEAFRAFLAVAEPTSSAIFTESVRNVPPTSTPNLSIFLLGPSNETDRIRVYAIYEVDLVSPSNRAGTYASVRRYVDGVLTHYYDVYYAAGSGDPFHPLYVAFEQRSRTVAGEPIEARRFQLATRSPFYLVWLPDPTINPYDKPQWTPVDATSSPRSTYEHMSGKTSFTTVLPMFPAL